jgi:hypothetical protein
LFAYLPKEFFLEVDALLACLAEPARVGVKNNNRKNEEKKRKKKKEKKETNRNKTKNKKTS